MSLSQLQLSEKLIMLGDFNYNLQNNKNKFSESFEINLFESQTSENRPYNKRKHSSGHSFHHM